jgi:hypothetical protein
MVNNVAYTSLVLPDFPKLRIELSRQLRSDFRRQTHHQAPLVAEIQPVVQHEGSGGTYEREDGEVKRITPKQTSVPLEWTIGSDPSFAYNDALKIINDAAVKMAREQTRSLFTAVDEAVNEVGNALDAKGQPISAELILNMWEKMHFDFDKLGKPQMPTMVFNPVQEERIKREFERLHNEPQLVKRHNEIMNIKLADWYDRESRRKLVD